MGHVAGRHVFACSSSAIGREGRLPKSTLDVSKDRHPIRCRRIEPCLMKLPWSCPTIFTGNCRPDLHSASDNLVASEVTDMGKELNTGSKTYFLLRVVRLTTMPQLFVRGCELRRYMSLTFSQWHRFSSPAFRFAL